MKMPAILALACCLCACATTDPKSAARIQYKLPRGDVKVTMGIDVVSCTPDVGLTVALKADANPGAQDNVYEVSGEYLGSAITKRSLTIDVDDNGVISGVNATATDQQTVILGNVFKIAATLGAFAAHGAATPVLRCNAATMQNLALKETLPQKLNDAKKRLIGANNPEGAQKEVVALTSQLAAAVVALHQDVTGKFVIEPQAEGKALDDPNVAVVDFDLSVLKSLFDTAYIGPGSPSPVPGVNDDTRNVFRVAGTFTRIGSPLNGLGDSGGTKPKLGECSLWMVVPSPVLTKVQIAWRGTGVKRVVTKGSKDPDATQTVPAAQLASSPSELCLSAGFGENRTVGLKFDKFGRTTQFIWASDASAANASGALAGASSDASTLVKELQGKDLADKKHELDELTTDQALRKARACQALLDAGATSCASN